MDTTKELYRLAEQGDVDAQYRLGWASYCGGKFSRAARWFRMAADRGHAQSQYLLGLLYFWGLGVKKDCARALSLFQLSAEQGNDMAMLELGVIYIQGKDVPLDTEKAIF